jgi:metal-responsive CopG/Arc/MetJ family transcriptional regulator
MVKYGMKITITLPKDVYEKLELDRGLVPRATYIQSLIRGGVKKEVRESQVEDGFVHSMFKDANLNKEIKWKKS